MMDDQDPHITMTASATFPFDAMPHHQPSIDMMARNPVWRIFAATSVFVFPRTMATDRTEESLAFRLPEISGCPVDDLPAITAGDPFTLVLRYCLTFLGTRFSLSLLDMRFLYSDIVPTDNTAFDDPGDLVPSNSRPPSVK